MSSLTPEPRVDVNGRVVIRHVRSDGPASHPRRGGVPLPTGLSSESHRAITDIVHNTLRDYLPMRSYSPIYGRPEVLKMTRADINAYFSGMSREIVDECVNLVFDMETDTGYPSLLVSAVHNREDSNMLSDITFLHRTEHFREATSDWTDDGHDIAVSHVYLRAMATGLRKYADWGLVIPERLQLASGDQQKIISALYQTTEMISIEMDSYLDISIDNVGLTSSISLREKALFEVISAHPENIDEIHSVLRARGCNGQVLADYFEEKKPMRNGIL